MYEQLNTQIEQASQRLAHWQELKGSLPQAQERLSQEAYRLRLVENELDGTRQDIEALETLTLESLIDAIMGRKERKLSDRRHEFSELQAKLDEGERTLLDLERRVRDIEEQVNALSDADEAYESLCKEKEQCILAADGDVAIQLRAIDAELDASNAKRRALESSVQVAKNLLERLHNMNNAVGRTRSKLLLGGSTGLVGMMAMSAVSRRGISGSVQRVAEGLGELSARIGELDLDRDCETDLEILRLASVTEGYRVEFSGNRNGKGYRSAGAILPVMEEVQNVLGHLRGKLEQIIPEIAAAEQEHRTLIRNA